MLFLREKSSRILRLVCIFTEEIKKKRREIEELKETKQEISRRREESYTGFPYSVIFVNIFKPVSATFAMNTLQLCYQRS